MAWSTVTPWRSSLGVHVALYADAGDDGLVFPALDGGPMRRSNFRRRVWVPATEVAGVEGLRFHDLRHTAARLAAASGASLKARMARIGDASAAAALRYQHVLDGQDNDIARFLDRFDWSLGADRDDPTLTVAHHDDPNPFGHVRGTDAGEGLAGDPDNPSDQDFYGGDDGTRTHDPLLAKQVL